MQGLDWGRWRPLRRRWWRARCRWSASAARALWRGPYVTLSDAARDRLGQSPPTRTRAMRARAVYAAFRVWREAEVAAQWHLT